MPKKLPFTFQESLGYGGKKIDEDKAVKILQRVGIDAIGVNGTPIEVAAYSGNIKLLNFIIESFKIRFPYNSEQFSIALSAASGSRALNCIQILVEEGANIQHLDKYKNTPLSNVFINTFSDSIPSAKYLIDKGAKITDRVIEMGMSWDSDKFTELLDSLGISFDRSLIPQKEVIETKITDTSIDIIKLHNSLNDKDYNKTLKVMWQELVPSSGQATTIQGELLRAIEKLRDEAQRNGNGNFHKNCHGLLVEYLKKYLLDESIFKVETISKIKKDLKQISYKTMPYTEDDIYKNISMRIVDWYLKNTTLLSHKNNEKLYC